jgi:NTP pyrophosphatase (non-canonical NTP hydrolase)
MSEFDRLQECFAAWGLKNFGPLDDTFHITKLTEEVGEAAHAVVRLHHQKQGKRINPNSEARLRDALGDIVIILMNLANNHDWSLEGIFYETADEVLARDYSKRA